MLFCQTTRIEPTSLRLEPLYVKIYLIYSNLFIHGIIPIVLLIFLNTAVYRQVGYHIICVGFLVCLEQLLYFYFPQIRVYRSGIPSPGSSLRHREIRLAQVSGGIVAGCKK